MNFLDLHIYNIHYKLMCIGIDQQYLICSSYGYTGYLAAVLKTLIQHLKQVEKEMSKISDVNNLSVGAEENLEESLEDTDAMTEDANKDMPSLVVTLYVENPMNEVSWLIIKFLSVLSFLSMFSYLSNFVIVFSVSTVSCASCLCVTYKSDPGVFMPGLTREKAGCEAPFCEWRVNHKEQVRRGSLSTNS